MQLRTVVIGTDYGEPSLETAAWVAGTLACTAELVLVHAIDDDTLNGVADEVAARDAAMNRMRDAVARFAHRHLRSEIIVGRPHVVIAEVAARTNAELIVVGPHANRTHERRLLGTTADRVVRGATRAVLVGARTGDEHEARIVCAVDDAKPSPDVLAWSAFASRALEARVTLLHVLSDGTYGYVLSVAAAHAHGDEALKRAEIDEELAYHTVRWTREAEGAGIKRTRLDVDVDHGCAAEVILETARHHDAALVVIGRHDGAPGASALLGRTVRHVLHGAGCPVIVVPHSESSD